VSVPQATTQSARARLARVAPFAWALVALASLALLAAGCGGAGTSGQGVAQVDTIETTTSESDSAAGSSSDDPTAYSACMRKHGVPKFPDPDSDGRLRLKAGPGTGLDPQSAVFKAAAKACAKLAPKGPSPAQRAKDQQQMLKFSACMRKHGVPNFPDPKFNPDGSGGISLDKGIDQTPQFKKAVKVCENELPDAGEGAGPSSEEGTP
jgi:hypothetical protein